MLNFSVSISLDNTELKKQYFEEAFDYLKEYYGLTL